MTRSRTKSTLETATARLREIALAEEEGAFLGSEEDLQARVGVARATLRQSARLVEREGLLQVRRGINGGYFASRPDLETIVASITSYLESLRVDVADLTSVASAMWVEAVRRAAGLGSAEAREVCEYFQAKVMKLPDTAGFDDMTALERESRVAVFKLINAPYVEFIFQVNVSFSRRKMTVSPAVRDNTDDHRHFISAWRKAKLLELSCIADGDQELATMAASHSRKLLHQRLWG